MDPRILVILALVGTGYYIGKPIVHGAKVGAQKTAHGIVRVVTLGKKH